MILGVNFVQAQRQALGFNLDGARALRPSVVRIVIDRPDQIDALIVSARIQRLKVIWNFQPELHGLPASKMAARWLVAAGLDVTAGVELGGAWPYLRHDAATHLAKLTALAESFRVLEVHDGRRRCAFGLHRPVILGSGARWFHRESQAYARELVRLAGRILGKATVPTLFDAFAVQTSPSYQFPIMTGRAWQAYVMDKIGLPLTFPNIGWTEGTPLARFDQGIESVARWLFLGRNWRRIRAIDAEIRARWFLTAFARASDLGAMHFIVSASTPAEDAVNSWGLYLADEQRPDPVWHKLQFAALRTAAA